MEIEIRSKRMILKEIELDLPYQKDVQYIEEIQYLENIEYVEAIKRDYENNWKRLRRDFQLKTKCMTSMIERIMDPIHTKNCWKILIECIDGCVEEGYKDLLGVCVVQVKFDKQEFFDAAAFEQKKKVIDIVLQGMNQLDKIVDFNVTAIRSACESVVEKRYYNEWYWNKPVYYEDKYAIIKIIHEISDVKICMEIKKNNVLIKDKILSVTLPDERMYNLALGKVQWVSKNEVVLITEDGKVYSCMCD